MSLPHRRVRSARPAPFLVALLLALACGGTADEGDEAAATSGMAGQESATEAGEVTLSGDEAVERYLELWDSLADELEDIHTEDDAREAAPRMSAATQEIFEVLVGIDPQATRVSQDRRFLEITSRYRSEIERITREAPGALPVLQEALPTLSP